MCCLMTQSETEDLEIMFNVYDKQIRDLYEM